MKILTRALSVTLAMAMSAGLALLSPASAQAAAKADPKTTFIDSVVSSAQAAQRVYGVPSSALIAEAIVDSNWGASAPATKARNYFNTACRPTMGKEQFAKLAAAQVGKKYVLGAEAAISNSDPSKFDCSELVEWLYGRSGNKITDLAASQYNVTKAVPLDAPAVGDLVFLRNNPARANGIGHVAVVTKKISGDWEIIEARGHAYGVVKTTLSYWKSRKYFAGLRRYPSFNLADADVSDTGAAAFQAGCVSVSVDGKSVSYSNYSSTANAFADRAATISSAEKYQAAMAAAGSPTDFVAKLAAADRDGSGDAYAKAMLDVISAYALTDYDVVPFTVVLSTGTGGVKVSAMQYLLRKAGYSVKVTGKFDSSSKTAVKKYQSAKKLNTDGEAGPMTLSALAPKLSSGAKGDAVLALNSLLKSFGYATDSGSSFKSTTKKAVKAFQAAVGLSASGTVTTNTWAKLFMAVDPAPVPTLSGAAVVDAKLTATAGTWGSGEVALAYQWYRGSTPIAGANAAEYAPQPADVGSKIMVAVTGSQSIYTPVTRVSVATAKVAKANFAAAPAPAISGTVAVGQTLTATTEGWAPAEGVSFSYQWNRDKKAIKGATKATYVPTSADQGNTLTVTVVGNKAGYNSAKQTSAATAKVGKGQLVVPELKLSGTAKVGKKLSVSSGAWAGVKVSLRYQWYRGESKIKGATKSSYKATKSDKGKVLTVVVTASATGFDSLQGKVSSAKIG